MPGTEADIAAVGSAQVAVGRCCNTNYFYFLFLLCFFFHVLGRLLGLQILLFLLAAVDNTAVDTAGVGLGIVAEWLEIVVAGLVVDCLDAIVEC